ncbi:MAG: LysR family transcriptional regulator [Pollutimonas bauzanensis]|uniref:DNA-binding transcriptional regulator, LysR family n=1 Tax=Pollutimonas bauzanensis TaxID=658167 RepID=A0A1M5WCA3_9BURK|nr:LysR family transcriptional regulator [Pollutimonas bauzanensis]SHH85122.1 DNA-binding transcriptional regulator, LysR family [Pollutimonas bauzanensis]
MTIHFDLTDMQMMINIGDSFSLTRAAEKSNLSVPAVSTRVKNLEDDFRTRLLYRTNQGVTLTPSGEALVRHARALMAQVEKLQGNMREFANGVRGRLRIMGNTTAMAEAMPSILGRFMASHPDIGMEIREDLSYQIVKAVADDSADIGIVGGRPPADGLQFLPYREDNLVLIVPSGHALAGQAPIGFADTLEYDYIGLSEWSAIHSFLVQTASALGRPFKFRAQVGNFEVVCRMIEANLGIGVVPKSLAQRYARTMDIGIIGLKDGWSRRRLHICLRDLDALPLFARDLVGMFLADAALNEQGGDFH